MIEGKNILYYLLWIFALILLFAVVTNIVVLCPFPIKVKIAGSTSDWIGYYAGVSANMISSIMAFTILYITYKQNEKNHTDLKYFQINNSTYTLERERLSQIESILKDEMFLLSPYRMSAIIMENGEIIDNILTYISTFKDELLRTEEEANFFINIYTDIIHLEKLTKPRLNLVELFSTTITNIRISYQNHKDIPVDYLQERMKFIYDSHEYKSYRSTLFEIIKEAEDNLYKKMADATYYNSTITKSPPTNS